MERIIRRIPCGRKETEQKNEKAETSKRYRSFFSASAVLQRSDFDKILFELIV